MPNSLLWIGLVVLWLFVLFPMLAGRHPRIRQTTDAALSTRVLHRGGSKREAARGQSVRHAEIDWEYAEEWMDSREHTDSLGESVAAEPAQPPTRSTALVPARMDEAFESGYEPPEFAPDRRGRGGFDPEADAVARAGRYAFRRRMVLALGIIALGSAILGGVAVAMFWWAAVGALGALGCYLGYLRKQVRMEEDIRRRRSARLARTRLEHRDVESQHTGRDHLDAPTPIAHRAMMAIEADDEDPHFDHLDAYDSYTAAAVVEPEPDDPELRHAAGA